MQKAYKLSVSYFLLFSLLLLLSSVMIFERKIGLSTQEVLAYYLGDETLFIPAKTISGVLKLVLPHVLAFGLFSMVLLHFLVFTKQKHKTKTLTLLIFMSALLEIFSPLFIILGFESFAYLKLFSFFLFESLFLYLLWLLFFSIVYE